MKQLEQTPIKVIATETNGNKNVCYYYNGELYKIRLDGGISSHKMKFDNEISSINEIQPVPTNAPQGAI